MEHGRVWGLRPVLLVSLMSRDTFTKDCTLFFAHRCPVQRHRGRSMYA